MGRARRTDAQVQGAREAARIAAVLGEELQHAVKRRHLTQEALGERVGLSQGRISELVRGEGATAPLDTWVAIGLAINRPLAVSFSTDLARGEPRDTGHLRAQELVLRLARQTGRRADFELPTRPANPTFVIDVLLRDAVSRVIVIIEIWNRLDDLGAAIRSTSRKLAESDGLAILAAGDGSPYRIASCWLLIDSAANRRLVARFPEIFRSRFPGSSIAWARCLVDGAPPPPEPGVTWIDARAGRIVPMRRRDALREGGGSGGRSPAD